MDEPEVNIAIQRIGDLWYGQESFATDKLHSIIINKAGEHPANIHDLSVKISHKRQGKNLHIIFDSVAKSASNKFHSYGPVETKLEISGLNIAALEKLIKHSKHSKKITKMILTSSKHPDRASSGILPLLAKGLQIKLNTLEMESNVGELHANASLIIPKQPSTEKPNFAYILLTMKLNVHVTASKVMLQQILEDYYKSMLKKAKLSQKTAKDRAQEQIKAWLDSKIIVLKDNNYQLDLTYAHATMTLNKA